MININNGLFSNAPMFDKAMVYNLYLYLFDGKIAKKISLIAIVDKFGFPLDGKEALLYLQSGKLSDCYFYCVCEGKQIIISAKELDELFKNGFDNTMLKQENSIEENLCFLDSINIDNDYMFPIEDIAVKFECEKNTYIAPFTSNKQLKATINNNGYKM